MNKFIRITNKSANYWLELGNKLGKIFRTEESDESLKEFCRAEYKKDWFWAYNEYQINGKFPKVHARI